MLTNKRPKTVHSASREHAMGKRLPAVISFISANGYWEIQRSYVDLGIGDPLLEFLHLLWTNLFASWRSHLFPHWFAT